MNYFARLAFAALVALFLASPAFAIQPTGSAAWAGGRWVAFDGTLYAAPGKKNHVVGALDDGQRVRVDRCTKRWCHIHTAKQRGWLSIDQLNFGRAPVKRVTFHLDWHK